jgi:hypothetical protein
MAQAHTGNESRTPRGSFGNAAEFAGFGFGGGGGGGFGGAAMAAMAHGAGEEEFDGFGGMHLINITIQATLVAVPPV